MTTAHKFEPDGLVTETTRRPPSVHCQEIALLVHVVEAAVKDDKFLLRMCSGGVQFISECIVNQVDGRVWNLEAVGSSPTILTISWTCRR